MDFSDVTRLAKEHLVDAWDHAFLVFEGDDAVRQLLSVIPSHKTVVLNRVPTVENLAAIAFELLRGVYDERFGNDLSLKRIRLFETPNCWADCS